ncbi:TPA_asm: hypothetical protein [Altiarchaeum virus]|nr:TPA_asm: hypothetical protein [Altiarchaeum virus]
MRNRIMSALEIKFREAIKLNPNDAEAHYGLGNLLAHLRLVDEAKTEWMEAFRINPNFLPNNIIK